MEIIKTESLSFNYPDRAEKALSDINLSIKEGEFITLCGKSGCGKTTLLRLLKTSISPFGKMDGRIYFSGKPLAEISRKEQAEKIGFVMQDVESQIVTDKVWHELSFGLESLGTPQEEIQARVSEVASFFGINNWFLKDTADLSGGQKQLLNLASVMTFQPDILILDEPTSQLDPISATEFLNVIKKINRELSITVILSEHRLEEAISLSDRVLVMDGGKLISSGTPQEVGKFLRDNNHPMKDAFPVPFRIWAKAGDFSACPLDIRGGRQWLFEYTKGRTLNEVILPKEEKRDIDKYSVELKDIFFRHEKNAPDCLKNLSLKIKQGELFALLGGNGAGKSTLLSIISGINRPLSGKVQINEKSISSYKSLYPELIGVLPQSCETIFTKSTVYDDLYEMLKGKELSKSETEMRILSVARLCQIEALLNFHPFDLSGGERQRAALSKVLLSEPEILILDEPTKGMDAHFKKIFSAILKGLKEKGTTIIMVSHDIEFCAENADTCGLLFDGKVSSVMPPKAFFAGKNFYTTQANKMSRGIIENAATEEDILYALGIEKAEENTDTTYIPPRKKAISNIEKKVERTNKRTKKISLKTGIVTALTVVLAFFTLLSGIYLFGDRKYYFISILIIFETFIPFIFGFEERKPDSRELVLISVLCAISVAGRAAFFMLPQFKPMLAIVIISGICLGRSAGFLTGAISAFVSNCFFGHGPWTPWHMFTFGIIGFLAAATFESGRIKPKKIPILVFGFLAAIFIYGGIMNPASVLMVMPFPTLSVLLKAYAAGIIPDLIHASSTAFFLFIFAEPFIEKINRTKEKFGINKK